MINVYTSCKKHFLMELHQMLRTFGWAMRILFLLFTKIPTKTSTRWLLVKNTSLSFHQSPSSISRKINIQMGNGPSKINNFKQFLQRKTRPGGFRSILTWRQIMLNFHFCINWMISKFTWRFLLEKCCTCPPYGTTRLLSPTLMTPMLPPSTIGSTWTSTKIILFTNCVGK